MLSPALLRRAAEYATKIEAENLALGRRNMQGASCSVESRISGYRGEAAVASLLGLEWVGNDAFRSRPDVGGFEVRTTKLPHGRLIIMPRDADNRFYALVIDESPAFNVVGYYKAGDAKARTDWWHVFRQDGGAWYVPQDELKPILGIVSPSLVRPAEMFL